MGLTRGRLGDSGCQTWSESALRRFVRASEPSRRYPGRPGDRTQRYAGQELHAQARERDVRLSYHSDTDSLYMHLSENPGTDMVEVSKDVAVDLDVDGNPVGIDIEGNASKIVDLSRLEFDGVSLESLRVASEPKDRRAVS
ncbi:MAG: DUF2283 domain-containing protein [Rubrobacter sp.]